MTVSALVAKLEAASFAYHNGQTELMTDAEYDAGIEQLTAMAPDHPFLKKVGAPTTGDEVALPIPLPSLNKIKDTDAIAKWLAKNPADSYHVSVKLDGCSALWLPHTKKLYTRGDGMRGRDISHFAPYFQGFPSSASASASADTEAVRGELILRTDSAAVPAGKLARNIVAGALNRKVPDPALFAQIQFIAYELLSPAAPAEAFHLLQTAGYKTATALSICPANVEPSYLSRVFTALETKSPYQLDGIVVAPNIDRPAYNAITKNGEAVNPTDRVAWKTRTTAATARTTVRQVAWAVSHQGFLIPRVLFDTVSLAGANIGAATGLHGRWIFDNGVGPGAVIEVRRAGDVIPQIIAVHNRVEPAMPSRYTWDSGNVHIRPVGDDSLIASACIQLTHALGVLEAENVGPGIVAKLYAAGFTTIGAIYKATVADFAAKVEGCKEKSAERIWTGLRAKQASWTTLSLMLASCTMPRSVGAIKLTPLLALEPNVALWSAATIKAAKPAGLSPATIDAIVEAVPEYLAWVASNGLAVASNGLAVAAAVAGNPAGWTVVFTGVRDKSLEASLVAAGHTVADAVTKKTTHVVYADGPKPSTTKITKAEEIGAKILSLSEFRGQMSP
jgi:DNA ligase (NAD+)